MVMPMVVPAVLAVGVVLAQISYPLLDGDAVRAATVTAVVLFAATSLTHAAATRGVRAAAALLVVAGGLGLLAEAVGIRTGFPFGTYTYADTLGPKLLDVPVVVPLAWTMMAYPCLLLGRRLAAAGGGSAVGRRARVALLGGLALAAWDLYLDPQMVEAGHWTWRFPDPALPGVPDIPVTNYAGWVLVAVTLVAGLDALVDGPLDTAEEPDPRAGAAAERLPAALLAWTWLGSGLANLAFFGRPAVAAYGLVAMGLLVGPYLARLRRDLARPVDARGRP
jgi:putative membrane protein